MGLDGRNAVVTGGGRGLGRAISAVLAAQGASVAVWDLNAEGAEQTVAQIREAGGKAVAIAGDAAEPAAVAAAAERVRAELGPVTILVNNAGVTKYVPFTELAEDEWDRMIRINLKGPYLVTKQFVPDMLEAGYGRIVNISSSSAQTGAPTMAHYAASKGGVIGFTKALAMEYAAKGITVNNVPPGFVDTPLLREGFDPDEVAKSMPMKRPGKPDDIAYAVAYLVSAEAGYVTGQTLSVNGGRYLV
ncbi:short-chain dehydrogenase/reductase SDR [Amycolatopsis mediterranei S699]|uniref:Short-chain dehydrogenase/reductase SDR n=3 Tax=Amycolatopsis mediterranei TaxID=33910 RepID=A0A0H3DDU1_AMYMU|nr:SDR family NAD(P)-dependent oxidoreductase [Amycolatopsis mediterranei]ADJ48861.1 short-chain dehydrogenase/reductase SDR [Amycolatopsis mediterranei U32]AEK45809.1 short-chain dehydrogenase/reductase SDR [Amycolatopsis mediterranei S699]AFO80569.1 short-chain dehydrogenase/reductase SDR [Amycolatopsis mediterranei S699]AGT87697.1 short-chain dehydrogenase/reductase SDR [Amycolatopsis mediterranei RB]KDU94024.1 short-chain dehydrogenase [Amycolatopsis mediterranei]